MTKAEISTPVRHVCGSTAGMPQRFVGRVLDLAPGYRPEDVERDLRCTLEKHSIPIHHALVLDLEGPEVSGVWAVWDSGDMAFSLAVLPDCLEKSRDGMQSCAEFAEHPGGHTWELTEPPLRGTVFDPSASRKFGPS